ncbi:MAG: outer membrane protein [Rhizobiaceae bacterium]
MKTLCLALLASAALPLAAAQAADIMEPIVPAGFTWEGAYVGVHAGYGWGRERDNQSDVFFGGGGGIAADKFDVDGFIGGVHAGYNWQRGNFVFGFEGDLDGADIKGSSDYYYPYGEGDAYYGKLSFKSDLQGSLRLRAGAAMDRALIYATGGVAFARGKVKETVYDTWYRDPYVGTWSDTKTHIGWTLGAGVEYAFTDKWIGRLEARYTDFGSKKYDLSSMESVKVDWKQTAVNVGLSYKF